MQRYMGFMLTAMRTFGAAQALDHDVHWRQRIVEDGKCIASIEEVTQRWHALTSLKHLATSARQQLSKRGADPQPDPKKAPNKAQRIAGADTENCKQFNYRGACGFGKKCRFKHACDSCGAADHGANACKNKKEKNSE
jgi:hypothetical protein